MQDMIDTGHTMTKLLSVLVDFKPKTLRVASLFVKRTPLSNGYRPDCGYPHGWTDMRHS